MLHVGVQTRIVAVFDRRKRHSFRSRSTRCIARTPLGGGSFGFLRLLRQASYHPEVVDQDGPRHRKLPVLNSFAAQRVSQNVVLKDRDPPFGLRSPTLKLLEFPGPLAGFHLLWRTRADSVKGFALLQLALIALTVKAPIRSSRLDLDLQGFLGAFQAWRQEP